MRASICCSRPSVDAASCPFVLLRVSLTVAFCLLSLSDAHVACYCSAAIFVARK